MSPLNFRCHRGTFILVEAPPDLSLTPCRDVAIIARAHCLQPVSFYTAFAENPVVSPLWHSKFAFPLRRLAALIESGSWTDQASEKVWKRHQNASSYQLWHNAPKTSRRMALDRLHRLDCRSCFATLKISLQQFLSFRLDRVKLTCDACGSEINHEEEQYLTFLESALEQEQIDRRILSYSLELDDLDMAESLQLYNAAMKTIKRQSIFPSEPITMSPMAEWIWLTHMLSPHDFHTWSESRFGGLMDRSLKGDSLSVISNTLSKLEITNPSSASEDTAHATDLTDRESCEVFRLCLGTCDAKKKDGVIRALVSVALGHEIEESAIPCTLSVLKEHCDTTVEDEETEAAKLLMSVFPGIIQMPKVRSWISTNIAALNDSNEDLTLYDVIPKAQQPAMYWHFLGQATEVRLKSDAEDETLQRLVLLANARTQEMTDVDIARWTREVTDRYPQLCARTIEVLDSKIDMYLPEIEEICENEREEAERLRLAQEEEERLEAERLYRESHTECTICAESLLTGEHFSLEKLTPRCEHIDDVCLSCLSRSIAAELEVKQWKELRCPTCSELLDPGAVERFADADTVSKCVSICLTLNSAS